MKLKYFLEKLFNSSETERLYIIDYQNNQTYTFHSLVRSYDGFHSEFELYYYQEKLKDLYENYIIDFVYFEDNNLNIIVHE